MAVGINFELGLVNVLTNFPLFLGAAEELPEAPVAVEFASALELPLACGRLPPFFHVRPEDLKDPEDFWNGLAESLANLVLI